MTVTGLEAAAREAVRRRLALRLALPAAAVAAIVLAGALDAARTLAGVSAETRRVAEVDAALARDVADLGLALEAAARAARLGPVGAVQAGEADRRLGRASALLSDVVRRAGGDRVEAEALSLAFGRAAAAIREAEEARGAPARAAAVFRDRVLPALEEVGAAIERLEAARARRLRARVAEVGGEAAAAGRRLGLLAALAVAAAAAVVLLVRRGVIEPLGRRGRAADRIAAGDLAARAGALPPDEIGDLGRHFDAMAERLAEAERERAAFLGMVTHDMRSPLAAIGAWAGLVREGRRGPVTPEQTRALSIIGAEADRLGRLVDDLLDTARAAAGEFRLEPAPCDPARALAEALRPLEAEAIEKGIALAVSVGGLPPAVLDAPRLARAVRNLVGNALKFARARVEVSGRVEGDDLVVEVADDGPGVPPEALPRLFERFYQADAGRDGRGGTGLGLAIVKAIAEAHGGRAEAENRTAAEGGAAFRVRIPLRAAGEAGERGEAEERAA